MNILHAPLKELAWFDGAREELKRKGKLLAGGCADAAKPHLVSALCEGIASPLILTWSDRRARELAEEYRIYDREVLVYPAKDLIFYEADINSRETALFKNEFFINTSLK